MRSKSKKLPDTVKLFLRNIRDKIRGVIYSGNGRFCPVCGKSSRRFVRAGAVPREEAQCAHCGALERHRLSWLFLTRRTNLFDGKPKKMLHVAPELCLEFRLREQLGENYITADLFNTRAAVKMDITNIDFPAQSFDFIFCSHVLEHVQDDSKAMKEFYRTMKDEGFAVLLVPIGADKTFEDPSIIDPKEKLKVFGQEDHVRIYGPDFVDRLEEAGFSVEIIGVKDIVQNNEVERMGLVYTSDEIYYCRKNMTINNLL